MASVGPQGRLYDPPLGILAPPDGSAPAVRVEYHRGSPRVMHHHHRQCELLLVRGGAGQRTIAGQTDPYSGMELVLLGPEVSHAWLVDSPPAGASGCDFTVVLFTRESLGEQLLSRPEFAPVAELLDRAARGVVFPQAVARASQERMLALPRLAGGEQLLEVLGLLLRLGRGPAMPIEAGASRSSPGLADRSGDSQRLARVLQFVHEHSHRPIRLGEVAELIHVSVPTFTRFFKSATGSTFAAYVNEWRLRRACLLLTGSSASVREIARRVGFANLSNFNRQFRRHTGTTPRRYRQGEDDSSEESSESAD